MYNIYIYTYIKIIQSLDAKITRKDMMKIILYISILYVCILDCITLITSNSCNYISYYLIVIRVFSNLNNYFDTRGREQ